MTLTVYNTLTRRQQPFETIEPGIVKMYCCGVTVYDYCHLGHARSYIVWDVVRRYLQWRGYQVRYIQNFTDIDDKILNRAALHNSTMEAVSNRFIDAYFEDIRRLNVVDADTYPRATEHIADIKNLIQTLVDKDLAYAAGGDVYYHVERFPTYGKLSGRELDQMQAGASGRVEVEDPESQKKQHPFDFALWKAAKPGEPAWDSPWGKGRPGWHIECSAMIKSRLGDTIDIHGGGGDLIFPHHENEIAQSEGAISKPLARYWMHNGMVVVDGQKMSKSLGNFVTIRELLDGNWVKHPRKVDPMAVRLFVLQGNYRKPLDFTEDALANAENSWSTLKEGLIFGQQFGSKLSFTDDGDKLDKVLIDRFNASADDDFNFSGGLAVLFELAKDLRREGNILVHEGKTSIATAQLQIAWHTLVTLAHVLGLEAKLEIEEVTGEVGLNDAQIDALIEQRQQARKNKDFFESDRIRNELQSQGIALIDTASGTTWHR
jgi:cysteinyl-tRNA synthetase